MKIELLDRDNYLEILPKLGKITEIDYVRLANMCLEELPNMEHIKVNYSFYCDNNKLISLKGCPYYIGGSFICSNNKLTSLNYLPSYIGVIFYGYGNTLPCFYYKMKEFNLNWNDTCEKLIYLNDKEILDNIYKSPELQRIYRNLLIKEILEL